MTPSIKPKLGIIAGGGQAALRLIESCHSEGRPFYLICLEGQADFDITSDTPHAWLPLGAFGKLCKLIEEQKIQEVVFIGRVRRPSLSEIHPDWMAIKALTKISFNLLGDDALLKAIGGAIEKECGVKVRGIHEFLGGILMTEGNLGKFSPDEGSFEDIVRGTTIARALGSLDIGQAIIIQQGLILGLEAIEGTDALMLRCKDLKREGRGGILIKVSKPQQDERFDLPTIGPTTVETAAQCGLCGIAIEAERSLLIDRDQVRQIADEKGLFIIGIR